MECPKENLSAYLDDELTTKEKGDTLKHLEECSRCAEEVKILSKLDNLIHQQEEIEASPEFTYGFWERIRQVEDRKKIRFLWLPIPATAVLLIIIFFHITSFSYALLNNKDFEVKNIVLQQVKETAFCPSISNISCLINLCDRCIHNLCKCKEIECKCKQCRIERRYLK